jgi:hypothetical protein
LFSDRKRGLAGVLAADAGEENGNLMAAAQAAPKRRGSFFQGEANERGHFSMSLRNKHSFCAICVVEDVFCAGAFL